jgi:hypothetical protein
LASDIGDVMAWCSSAENPEKILLFINNSLIHLASPALELLGKNKKEEKKGNKWWLSLYAHSVAVIGIYIYIYIYIYMYIDKFVFNHTSGATKS